MKKLFSVLCVLCFTFMMIVGMAACGKKPAETETKRDEEQFVIPKLPMERLPKYCDEDCSHERTRTPCEQQDNDSTPDGEKDECPKKCPYRHHGPKRRPLNLELRPLRP
ncbi:MAG: hypothetical protein K2G44_04145 [Clostridia bacterium]|nr:hypothetical protein [Clostridia bacterium]